MTIPYFTDPAGRVWTIRFDYDAVVRMRAAGFDLRSAPVDIEREFSRVASDPILLIDVIAAALKPDIEDEAAFKRSLYGDSLDAASDAFLRAIADFFPKLRPLILASLNRLAALQSTAATELSQKIESGQLDQFLQTVLSVESGSAPGSSASIPADSASAS